MIRAHSIKNDTKYMQIYHYTINIIIHACYNMKRRTKGYKHDDEIIQMIMWHSLCTLALYTKLQ